MRGNLYLLSFLPDSGQGGIDKALSVNRALLNLLDGSSTMRFWWPKSLEEIASGELVYSDEERIRARLVNGQQRNLPLMSFQMTSCMLDWHVLIFFTLIPCLRILSSRFLETADREDRWWTAAKALLAAGEIDLCGGSLRSANGLASTFYLGVKTERSPQITALQWRQCGHGEASLLWPLRQKSAELLDLPAEDGSRLRTLPKGRALRRFLRDCDETLVDHLGEAELGRLLQPLGISAKAWLRLGRGPFGLF